MKLTTNLATRRYVNLRRLNTWLVASSLILAALLVYKVREIASNQVEINQIKRQSAIASRGSAGGAVVSAEQLKALDARIAFANELIGRKTINWLGLLDKLEEVVPAGVALTQVEPVPQDQTLRLTGVTRSFANLRTFLENMEQSQNFSEVYLLSQNELKVGATQEGYNFTVSCKVSYR